MIGAASKRFTPLETSQTTYSRSNKSFKESDFCGDLDNAPFDVLDMFDDVDDMACFTSSIIKYVVDHHAPVKSTTEKSQSVSYMNSALRKVQYKGNMTRNKFD